MESSVDERIDALAAAQCGVVARRQLMEVGLTRRSIGLRVRKKRLRPVQRGVYRVGPLMDPRAREMAAVLACGGRAFVSHHSCAWLWEVGDSPGASSPVDVVVPNGVRIRRPGIRVRRVLVLTADDVTRIGPVPVTTPARTIIDLAGELAAPDLERIVARFERRNLVTLDELAAWVDRFRGQPGVAVLIYLLEVEGGPAFTRSMLEERFVQEARRFGLPVPKLNSLVLGFEVDAYWPEAQLVLELDGAAYHGSWDSQRRDRRRDVEFATHGIDVIRITWPDLVHDTEKTMVRVAQALAIGRYRFQRATTA